LKGLLEFLETRVSLVLLVLKDSVVSQENVVKREKQEFLHHHHLEAQLVYLVELERREKEEFLETTAYLEFKENVVNKEALVSSAWMDLEAHLD
jgi:hypothetical protein